MRCSERRHRAVVPIAALVAAVDELGLLDVLIVPRKYGCKKNC
jgi:hypothetical protein